VALVRRPGRRLAEGIVTHLDRVPVDVDLARRQHEGYRAALRRCGWRVVEVAPTDRHPDAVFVEDTVVVVDDLAVLTRPGAPSRRGELAGTEAVVRALGLRPVRIEQPATLDGGDVLQAGRTVYVGLGGRTTRAGIDQLRGLLEPLGRTVVAVRLGEVLHLKSAVTALPDGSLVGLPHLVDTDVLPPVQAAEEEGGAHVVPLGGASILLAASAPRTAARLAAAGWLPEVVDIGEFEKLEGCVTCLSVLVPGDSLDRVGRT
jgi:dimethylargininase